jgi:hypothetical protein
MDGGRVYSSFDRDVHLKALTVNVREPLWWTLDFNVDPMSSVIAQRVNGVVQVLSEIVIRRGTTAQACEQFLAKYGSHQAGVIVCGDASGYQSQTSGTTDYDMVQDYFSVHSSITLEQRAQKCNPSVRERINIMNRQLKTAGGTVGLLIDASCKELVKDFEEVCFKEDSMQIDKDRDRLRTHLSDALGYLVWQVARPQGKIGERNIRIV